MPTHFRPCIDLHEGKVKQIVGGTLETSTLKTNFTTDLGAGHFARLYRADNLQGGHVIKLGRGNDEAAREALAAWPRGLQLGGGVDDENSARWLEAGADKVIVTSWLFRDDGRRFDWERLDRLSERLGRDRLVVDLSCRRGRGVEGGPLSWFVATNRWQTISDLELNASAFETIGRRCAEFLVHAADVEGLCRGIDEELVRRLAAWSPVPCTYAGGGRHIRDLETVDTLSHGRVDLSFGSALDIFGGTMVKYADCVEWNRSHPR